MSVLNENISIKIKDVLFLSWERSMVSVAPRPYHALVFRLCGEAVFLHKNFRINTNSSDVFYMPAGYDYDAIYSDKNDVIVIHFESDLVAEPENFKINNPKIISKLFHEIYEIWEKKAEGYYYSAICAMCEILKSISVQRGNFLNHNVSQAFEKAIKFMENNYTNVDFSIAKMIEMSHMSNTYFRRIFFEKFGTTPIKCLISKRLLCAEKLLATGRYSVKEVAEMSGFDDVKYFSRVVKKEFGVPPSKLYYIRR